MRSTVFIFCFVNLLGVSPHEYGIAPGGIPPRVRHCSPVEDSPFYFSSFITSAQALASVFRFAWEFHRRRRDLRIPGTSQAANQVREAGLRIEDFLEANLVSNFRAIDYYVVGHLAEESKPSGRSSSESLHSIAVSMASAMRLARSLIVGVVASPTLKR